MQQTVYKGVILAKGSRALQLYQNWQSAKPEGKKATEKLFKDHMAEVDKRYKALVE